MYKGPLTRSLHCSEFVELTLINCEIIVHYNYQKLIIGSFKIKYDLCNEL